jgi:hypothetical protein
MASAQARGAITALAGTVLAPSDASATTLLSDFASSTPGYYAPTRTFAPSGAPSLEVSAFTVSDNAAALTPVAGRNAGVGQWAPNGVGLAHQFNDSSHTVDGLGRNDLLVLKFDTAVKLLKATFSYAGRLSNSNDGFAFFRR